MLKLATSSILLPEYKRKVLQLNAQRKLAKTTESASNRFNQSGFWSAEIPPCTQMPHKQRNAHIWVLIDEMRTTAGSRQIALLLNSASYNRVEMLFWPRGNAGHFCYVFYCFCFRW